MYVYSDILNKLACINISSLTVDHRRKSLFPSSFIDQTSPFFLFLRLHTFILYGVSVTGLHHLHIILIMLNLDMLIQCTFHTVTLGTCRNWALVQPHDILCASALTLFAFVIDLKWHIELQFMSLLVLLQENKSKLESQQHMFRTHYEKMGQISSP